MIDSAKNIETSSIIKWRRFDSIKSKIKGQLKAYQSKKLNIRSTTQISEFKLK